MEIELKYLFEDEASKDAIFNDKYILKVKDRHADAGSIHGYAGWRSYEKGDGFSRASRIFEICCDPEMGRKR